MLELAPAHAEAYALLARIYEEQKKVAEALAVCRRAIANEKLTAQQRYRFQARVNALTAH
jgi:hypothetical protein